MASDSNKSLNITGLFNTLLLLMFIGFKLSGIIDWSWWWVMSPIWIPLSIVLVALGVIEIFIKERDVKPKEPVKSKWQERLDEMTRQRESK